MHKRITVDGDKDGGWLVEIHDGDQMTTHSADGAETWQDALMAALGERFSEPSPKASDFKGAKQQADTKKPGAFAQQSLAEASGKSKA